MPGDRAVEGGAGRGERRRHRRPLAGAADRLGEQLDRRGHQSGRRQRPGEGADHGPAEQLELTRVAAERALATESQRRLVGLEGAQVRDQVGARDAVDGGVVHLGEHGDLVVVVPLDHPHLPQRAGAVERLSGEVAAELDELGVPTGLRQGQTVDVPVDVEVLVLDPDRVVQLERHLAQLAGELGDVADPAVDQLLELPEGVAVRHRARVQHDDAAHVQQLLGRLQVEEARVEA